MLILLSFVCVSCAPAPPEIAPLAPELGPSEPRTWTEAGPVFEERCVRCHQDGGVAPFRLDDHETAQTWASASAAAVLARSMPPFLVRGDGSCGEYQHNEWLSTEELSTLVWWAEQGAPEGDGYSVSVPTPPTLQGNVLEQTLPRFEPIIVGGEEAEFDEYRCFRTDLPEGTARFLTGWEVVPENEAIVHHVIGYPVVLDDLSDDDDGRTNRQVMEDYEAEDPRDGWPCFGEAGRGLETSGPTVTWAPGQGAVLLPEGTGIELPEGATMVYQVHYNLADPTTIGQEAQPTVRIQLEEAVQRPIELDLTDGFLGGWSTPGRLAPGQEDAVVYFEFSFDEERQVLGVLPHMHEQGTALQVYIGDGPQRQCLTEVPAWNFEWQRLYLFQEPVELPAGTTIHVWCTYDTRGSADFVLPGWGTRNEMCLPGLLLERG